MLANLFMYLYVLFFCFSYGLLTQKIVVQTGFIKDDTEPNFFDLIFSGFSVLMMIVGIYSVFFKIGLSFHFFLLAISVIFFILFRKDYFKILTTNSQKKIRPIVLTLGIVFLLVFLLCSSSYILWYAYDTGLYHAQFIRWIESFSVVKGLGNLDGRLAFNSHFDLMSAFF